MRVRGPTNILQLAAAAGLAACGGGGDGTSAGTTPSSISAQSGNTQVGAAGAALTDSLAIIVRDGSNSPVSGVNVAFAVTAGGGFVSPASRTTDAAGIARTRFTLGTGAGTNTATATVSGLLPVTFTAVAQIQGAVFIANQTTAPLVDTTLSTRLVSVRVTNQNAAPVAGVNVEWAAPGGGQVSAPTMATNASGVSQVSFTYGGTAGPASAIATVTGLVNSPVTVNLTGVAGYPTQIVKTSGDGGIAGSGTQVTYTVTVLDARNNPRQGVTVNWATAAGGGSITPASNTTGPTGTAQANRTMGDLVFQNPQTATATAPAIVGTNSVTFSTTLASVITVADNSFTPATVFRTTGATLNWQWSGVTSPHNITFAAVAGAPANEPDRTQGLVTRTFNTLGTFNYSCTNHVGMSGTVTITP